MPDEFDYDEIFDWTREPRNERERKIRQRWLDRKLETELGCKLIQVQARLAKRPASDIAAALREAERRLTQARSSSKAEELNDIIAELERGGEL